MTQQPEALRIADALETYGPTPWASTAHQAAAELRRLHNLCAEWEQKAATWLASPEAAKRLAGYRELTDRITTLEAALRQTVEALEDAKTFTGAWPAGAVTITAAREALEGKA